MKTYLLQHGNYGEGPINAYMVSTDQSKLIEEAKRIAGDSFKKLNNIFDSGDCVSIELSKDLEYNGFNFNMFFIDTVKSI